MHVDIGSREKKLNFKEVVARTDNAIIHAKTSIRQKQNIKEIRHSNYILFVENKI